jgi:transcription initiation factor IIE alpha subunit
MSESELKENFYKCEDCKSKFKKSCPKTLTYCQPIIKCAKCGGKLNKIDSRK